MAAETSNETLPLWLQELIQTNRSGLVSIVTKNISIENVDEEKGVHQEPWNTSQECAKWNSDESGGNSGEHHQAAPVRAVVAMVVDTYSFEENNSSDVVDDQQSLQWAKAESGVVVAERWWTGSHNSDDDDEEDDDGIELEATPVTNCSPQPTQQQQNLSCDSQINLQIEHLSTSVISEVIVRIKSVYCAQCSSNTGADGQSRCWYVHFEVSNYSSINTEKLCELCEQQVLKCDLCHQLVGENFYNQFTPVPWANIRLCSTANHLLCVPFVPRANSKVTMVEEKYCNGIVNGNHHHHYGRSYGTGRHSYIKNGGCKLGYEIKRPSSVSSGGSGDSGKDLDGHQSTREDFDLLSSSGDSDYEYGPGIVDRLRHKFMALSNQSNGLDLVKRCASMEELAFKTTALLIPKNVPVVSSASRSSKLINGTKRKILNQFANGHHYKVNSLTRKATNGIKPASSTPKVVQRSALPAPPPVPSVPPPPPPTVDLYPHNIVKQFLKNHQTIHKEQPPELPVKKIGIVAPQTNGDISRNSVNNLLLLGAPMPYIKRSKSVDTLVLSTTVANGKDSVADTGSDRKVEIREEETAEPSKDESTEAASSHARHAPIAVSEMPKPDMVKTVKRLFECNNASSAVGCDSVAKPSHVKMIKAIEENHSIACSQVLPKIPESSSTTTTARPLPVPPRVAPEPPKLPPPVPPVRQHQADAPKLAVDEVKKVANDECTKSTPPSRPMRPRPPPPLPLTPPPKLVNGCFPPNGLAVKCSESSNALSTAAAATTGSCFETSLTTSKTNDSTDISTVTDVEISSTGDNIDDGTSGGGELPVSDMDSKCESKPPPVPVSPPPSEPTEDGSVIVEVNTTTTTTTRTSAEDENRNKLSTVVVSNCCEPDVLPPSREAKMPPPKDSIEICKKNEPKSALWSKTAASVQSTGTTMVFDFRDKKSITAHVAIQPTPFGSKPIPKNIAKQINGAYNPDDYEDEDCNYCGTMEMPPPCGIHFEGENVVVRSSMLEKRNKNLSIQFDDSAIQTFEYPFEDDDDESTDDDEQQSASTNSLNSTSTTLQNKFLAGTSTLASYKPSQIGDNRFELGIVKSKRPEMKCSPNERNITTTTTDDTNCADTCDTVIKPASVEDTVTFSQSTIASDLLF